jgi:hypothetical protein
MTPVLHVGGPYDVSGAQTPDDPLILQKLTIEDMDRASGTGRYGDSTEDYAWNEMSTGALDWAFVGFAARGYWDANGLTFIILHELVHGSPFGERIRDAAYAMHLLFYGVENRYEASDFWWDVNEESANWGAREIMEAFLIPPPTHRPPYGYDDSMPSSPLTLPPPPPPYFGDDSGGGNVGE